MSLRNFSLIPFPAAGNIPDIRITGSVSRRKSRLSVRYALLGKLSDIAIPAREKTPSRKVRLWEETCLEFFLGLNGSGRYWEFNLSPAGNWNVFRFTGPREGMLEEPAFSSLQFVVRKEPEALRLSVNLDIGKIIAAAESIHVAVCAVIKTLNGGKSHWALAHPAPRPDFHRREGFQISLPGH